MQDGPVSLVRDKAMATGWSQDQADARVLKAVERATPSRGFEIPPLRFVYCKAGVEARLREGAIFK